MDLKLLTPEEYAAIFDRHVPHVYNTVAFNEHNRHKSEALLYLAFADNHPRAGIIMGQIGTTLRSPFSAPFGGLTATDRCDSTVVHTVIASLRTFCRNEGLEGHITLPPSFYAPSLTAAQSVALTHAGVTLWSDINHHHVLCDIGLNPAATFRQKARNAANAAGRHGLTVTDLDSGDRCDVERLYRVIEENHRVLGHPLAMTASQILTTAPITGSRMIVMSHDSTDVAAAMINIPAPGIGQVIYWGDTMEGRKLHAMNLLAAEVMVRCRQWGLDTLDIGPSSKEGIIAPGLCRFKESIGCLATVKPTFRL